MRSDDDISYCSITTSKSRGSRSLPGAFAIDWDEIDSIAQESISVCSSASGSHRRRKNATASHQQQQQKYRRSISQNQLDSKAASQSLGRSTSCTGSRGNSKGPDHSRSRCAVIPSNFPKRTVKRGEETRMVLLRAKQIVLIGGMFMIVLVSVHLFASCLDQFWTTKAAVSFAIGDRQVRKLLAKSTREHNTRHWPVSVSDEENDFELITHPGNTKVTLSVPRFFLTNEVGDMHILSPGNGMTKKLAEMVGRTTVDGSLDFSVRTIFVGVASFRDWHCRYTIESLFARAKFPERIRIGVVDQLETGEGQSCDVPIVPCQQNPEQALCQYRSQIDVYEMEANLAVGPMFARHIVNRMYRGEYYNLQIDAHTVFVKNWDVDMIEQLESTGNDMAVISTYLDDALGSIDEMSGTSIRKSRPVICNAAYEGTGKDRWLRHTITEQPNLLPAISGTPQLQPYWSSSFSFSRGHFVLSVPYDSSLPMLQREDEEISMAIRAFTNGYDFYTPERNVCFDSAFNDRDSRKSFLEHKQLYSGLEDVSRRRMHWILGMETEKEESNPPHNSNELFSIGKVRELSKFWNSFGIHVRERITERKLCNFVSTGNMHKVFHEHLKPDGMGLDYSKINLRFHELQNNHES